ncbi:hypothetical protein EMCG_05581 [[Emmonsia] crescens]|uniref:Uncharacterized protein n=1 Tax=[Emmonsia] crescens TaxID=73230 RepID=A0A0G2HPF7_9EURO|nr:hypothetical protein EMCG_05581 [Emmonsia crescens UAMH 3008]
MVDNTAVLAAANGTSVNPGNIAASPASPNNTAAVALRGDASTSAIAVSGGKAANVDNPHGRYWRFCKKCRHVRPTRWSYWEDKRNPPTSRYFWYCVSFAWRYLSASRCPECKCKLDDSPVLPLQEGEGAPIQTQGPEQEQVQEQDIQEPE